MQTMAAAQCSSLAKTQRRSQDKGRGVYEPSGVITHMYRLTMLGARGYSRSSHEDYPLETLFNRTSKVSRSQDNWLLRRSICETLLSQKTETKREQDKKKKRYRRKKRKKKRRKKENIRREENNAEERVRIAPAERMKRFKGLRQCKHVRRSSRH